MTGKIDFVGELTRLDYKPGDVFVIHTTEHLSAETAGLMQGAWIKFWEPEPAPKLLIMDKGVSLGALRQEAK